MSAGDFAGALQAVQAAERDLTPDDHDGWLRRSCLSTAALVHRGKTVCSATTSGSIGFFDVCSISVPSASVTNCLQVSPNAHNTQVFSCALVVSSDSTRVYGFSDPYSIGVFDATSLVLLNSIQLTDPANAAVDSLVYSPATNSLYVSSYGFGGPNTIFRIDLGSFTVAAQQTLTYQPLDIAVTPSGSKVLAVGIGSPTPILDGTTLAQTGTIPTGRGSAAVIGHILNGKQNRIRGEC